MSASRTRRPRRSAIELAIDIRDGHGNGTAGGRWEPRLPGQPASPLDPHALVWTALANSIADRRGLRVRDADKHPQANTPRPQVRTVHQSAALGANIKLVSLRPAWAFRRLGFGVCFVTPGGGPLALRWPVYWPNPEMRCLRRSPNLSRCHATCTRPPVISIHPYILNSYCESGSCSPRQHTVTGWMCMTPQSHTRHTVKSYPGHNLRKIVNYRELSHNIAQYREISRTRQPGPGPRATCCAVPRAKVR